MILIILGIMIAVWCIVTSIDNNTNQIIKLRKELHELKNKKGS